MVNRTGNYDLPIYEYPDERIKIRYRTNDKNIEGYLEKINCVHEIWRWIFPPAQDHCKFNMFIETVHGEEIELENVKRDSFEFISEFSKDIHTPLLDY